MTKETALHRAVCNGAGHICNFRFFSFLSIISHETKPIKITGGANMVKILVENGADVNAINIFEMSPAEVLVIRCE